jgi:hypothetical protein
MTSGTFAPKPPVPDEPLKHVIDEYRHSAQQVTCVCGWQGSSASDMGGPSPWTLHVRQYKAGKR